MTRLQQVTADAEEVLDESVHEQKSFGFRVGPRRPAWSSKSFAKCIDRYLPIEGSLRGMGVRCKTDYF